MVSMLYKTNIFCIIGSENNPDYKQNQVLIYDDLLDKILYKITLNEKALNIKLTKDKVFIVTINKIFVLNSKDEYSILFAVDTCNNPNGLIVINYSEENAIMVYPSSEKDQTKGELTIKYLDKDIKDFKYLSPHVHKIAHIALSYNGLFLVTASEEGKTIRIYETENLEKLEDLTKEKSDIKYINIDSNNQFLAASNENGIIYIWSLYKSFEKLKQLGKGDNNVNENKILNTGSILANIPILGGKWFDKNYCFAQVKLDQPNSIFHFGPDNTLIIVTSYGKYYKAKIDMKKGGDCQIIEEHSL